MTQHDGPGSGRAFFVDTTFRDGSQSLWAMGMRHGMMQQVAPAIDRAGFQAVEVPVTSMHFKKIVRDLKEDPWEMLRMLVREMPHATLSCMVVPNLNLLGVPSPLSIVELFYRHLVDMGALHRIQITANTFGQLKHSFPYAIPFFRSLGVYVGVALSYTISPRHTDAYYAEKTRQSLAFKPDMIYLKDQGGLLTVDRARTLLPTLVENAGGLPVELHSHCTTGMADAVYLEALSLGIRTLHTALPPLARGSSQPSVFDVAQNARLSGFAPQVDEHPLRPASERLRAIAQREGLPVGAPSPYDVAQYVHQIPGGVISNLKHQLISLHLEDRLDEVIEESVRVREELGYPIMITPLSQFVVTQAAVNVAAGERYKVVIDDILQFAKGAFGEDSGYPWMDQNLRDRLLSMPRAKELPSYTPPDIPLKRLQEQLGGPGVSDEELLLRYIMHGEKEIEAMRAAGPPRQYTAAGAPLLSLLEHLKDRSDIRHARVQKGSDFLEMRKA